MQRRPSRRLLNLTATIEPQRFVAIACLAFLLILGVWWAVTEAGLVRSLFLPSPPKVLHRLISLAQSGDLANDLVTSLARIAIAFALSCALAIPGGILIGSYRVLDAFFEPVIDFIRYMPVVAFVPLTILWFGTGEFQKWLIIWIGTFFQQILMVQDSVKRVPRDFVDVGRTLQMPERNILFRIVLPSAAPGIWDGMRICLGWAWSWLVLAELVAATSGLGYRITVAQRYFQTDTIIGYVVVLGVLGLVSDQVMKFIGRRMFKYLEAGR
ncbi:MULTISPECIES: ABC transporter permease [unclassified Hyphomicrobium]|nr:MULTISPECIES: ABC transporter permease [unclassified Hyphomicrobium]